MIKPENYYQCDDILQDRRNDREPLEKMMGEEYDGYSQRKRQRFQEAGSDDDSFDTQRLGL